jgi:hypothetical protein
MASAKAACNLPRVGRKIILHLPPFKPRTAPGEAANHSHVAR